MTPQPHPKCAKCKVRYMNCGLNPKDCEKTYPISDKELEFILQTNENLPTDELEIPVRDLIVMDIRERQHDPRPHQSAAPSPETILCCAQCPCRQPDCEDDCKGWQMRIDRDNQLITHTRNETLDAILPQLIKIKTQLPTYHYYDRGKTKEISCELLADISAAIYKIESLRTNTSTQEQPAARPTKERHIRESHIALNPVIIDDSIRGDAPEPEPKFTSTDLLLLANDEWKRREERKHNHENAPWTAGFINGFMTNKKWARELLDKLPGYKK